LVHKELRVHKVFKARQEIQVHKVSKDLQMDLPVHRAIKDPKVFQVLQDHREFQV
jgi:hypothetical protein